MLGVSKQRPRLGVIVSAALVLGVVASLPSAASASAVTVSIVAGNGTDGTPVSDGGAATSSSLWGASGLLVTTDGLMIADKFHNEVRQVDSTGNLQAWFGNGTATCDSTTVWNPSGMAAGPNGTIFVSSQCGEVVQVSPDHTAQVVAGNMTDPFYNPTITPGMSATAADVKPAGLAYDPATDSLYIADGSNRILKVSGGVISVVAGTGTAGFNGDGPAATTQLNGPTAVAYHSGLVYVADMANGLVRTVDSGGNVATIASVELPNGLAFDSTGKLYVASANSGVIYSLDSGGILATVTSLFAGVNGIAFDANDNLFASGTYSTYVYEIQGLAPAVVAPQLSATPSSQSLATGASANVDADLTLSGVPVGGVSVVFTVTSGPCQGTHSTGSTDATGLATFSYTCTGAGVDQISATATSPNSVGTAVPLSAQYTVTWSSLASYVALGDSYSSGEGNPPYDPGTNSNTDRCHRSSKAWPRLLAADSAASVGQLTHLACSGARMSDLISTSRSGEGPQLSVLTQLKSTPSLVTVSIFGNDIGFVDVLKACVLASGGCAQPGGAISIASARISQLSPTLVETLKSVKQAAKSARVVLVGYPSIFPAVFTNRTGLRCAWLSSNEDSGLLSLTDQLDSAELAAAESAGVEYLSLKRALAGHELCTGKSWVTSLTLATAANQSAGHPVLQGQQAMETAILSYLTRIA